MSKHKELNQSGYLLSKKALTDKEIAEIKEDLTVTPKVCTDYGGVAESFSLYSEDKEYLYTPRYWAVSKYGKPKVSKFNLNKQSSIINVQFKGQLRDKQIPIVETCLDTIKKVGGGIISVHCGGGKTTMSLYLVSKLKLKTLVIVHKSFLQDQWYERIKQFTNARVGIIRQDKVDIKDKDIVIGMIQSISLRDYDSTIFDDFGVLIVDEAHHVGSKIYSKAIQKVRPKYTIGLSATPDRYDGMTKVIKWHLGDIIYKSPSRVDKNVVVKKFIYETNDKLFVEKKMWQKGKTIPAIQRMITNMYKMSDRNTFLVNLINSLRKQYERKILILSERLIHLDKLKTAVDAIISSEVKAGILEEGEVKTAKYIGKMKAYELVDAAEADIIFATYSMAAEGLDIDRLNTLVLATPKMNIIQSIGRIMRKPIQEGDINPLIVDVIDHLSVFTRWGSARDKFYINSKYKTYEYQSFNKECISMVQYLQKNKVVPKDKKKLIDLDPKDLRREYLRFKFGDAHLELEDDLVSTDEEDEDNGEEEDNENFAYEPDLDNIFDIQIEYVPEIKIE